MNGLVAAAILVPIVLGVLLLILRRLNPWTRNLIAVFGSAATLGLAIVLWVTAGTGSHEVWFLTVLGDAPVPLLVVDGIGLLLAVLFSFVWLLVTIFSLGYLKGHPFQDDYYGFLLVMLGSVVGFCLSQNLLTIYVFWEVAGIATWRLVAFYRNDREIRAATKTLFMTFTGSVLMLVGFAGIFVEHQTLNVSSLAGTDISLWASLLILVGMITKSASLPFYIWLPDAHTVAPSPMSALLSGIIAKIGLIAYLRIFILSQVGLPDWWPLLIGGLGVAGALVAGGCALRESDYKRLLAYSTVSQLGYVFIGFAFAAHLGAAAGVIYLVAHCLAKAGLFLSMGIVERATHKRRIDELGGLARSMPVTAVSVAVLMLSIIGLPPFLGFFGKFYVVLAAVRGNMVIAVGGVIAAVVTVFYMLRMYRMFVGEPREGVSGRDLGVMTATVVILAVASIALGLLFPWMSGFLNGETIGVTL
jgi:formate hydrogenlyase subunit 3/multisubunit Na+/H+ antiporter MnhD subunit